MTTMITTAANPMMSDVCVALHEAREQVLPVLVVAEDGERELAVLVEQLRRRVDAEELASSAHASPVKLGTMIAYVDEDHEHDDAR